MSIRTVSDLQKKNHYALTSSSLASYIRLLVSPLWLQQ